MTRKYTITRQNNDARCFEIDMPEHDLDFYKEVMDWCDECCAGPLVQATYEGIRKYAFQYFRMEQTAIFDEYANSWKDLDGRTVYVLQVWLLSDADAVAFKLAFGGAQ